MKWNEVEKLAQKISWKYAKATGQEFEDLLSICKESWAETSLENQGETTTYFYLQMEWHIKKSLRHSMKFQRSKTDKSSYDRMQSEPHPALARRSAEYEEFLESLSEQELFVTKLLTDPPEEISTIMIRTTPTALRAAVKKFLKQTGWTRGEIERSFGGIHWKFVEHMS